MSHVHVRARRTIGGGECGLCSLHIGPKSSISAYSVRVWLDAAEDFDD